MLTLFSLEKNVSVLLVELKKIFLLLPRKKYFHGFALFMGKLKRGI